MSEHDRLDLNVPCTKCDAGSGECCTPKCPRRLAEQREMSAALDELAEMVKAKAAKKGSKGVTP